MAPPWLPWLRKSLSMAPRLIGLIFPFENEINGMIRLSGRSTYNRQATKTGKYCKTTNS